MGDHPRKSNIMLPVVVFIVMMMTVAAHQQMLTQGSAVVGEWVEACLLCLPEQLTGCLIDCCLDMHMQAVGQVCMHLTYSFISPPYIYVCITSALSIYALAN
jgi:hypothetical protein